MDLKSIVAILHTHISAPNCNKFAMEVAFTQGKAKTKFKDNPFNHS